MIAFIFAVLHLNQCSDSDGKIELQSWSNMFTPSGLDDPLKT